MATTSSTALSRLRTTALVIVACVLVQAALGIASLTGYPQVNEIHGWIGYVTFIASIVAAVLAFNLSKLSARFKGTFFHALSLPVLALVQIGIIEASQGAGAMKWLHVVLGIAFVVASVGLYAMTGAKQNGRSDVVA
ncbi:hypothetical protein [Luteococcus peritonei]|uniref:Cytochrome b561 domain-containing protein n=1 Tax=Luteococcus peritonei TaxID=88874 RepID=A0ABW4RV51_9ACTN